MPDSIHLVVASPERKLVDQAVDSLQAPAVDGSMGVLPGHAALLTELGCGVLTFESSKRRRYIVLQAGLMEVLPDKVRVLATLAEWADEVDIEREKVELQRAMDLLEEHDLEVDVEKAQAAVALAQAKMAAYNLANGI